MLRVGLINIKLCGKCYMSLAMTTKDFSDENQDSGIEGAWVAKSTPSQAKLRQAIQRVAPKEETEAGILYFSRILDKRGPKGLLDTLARFRKMLDEGDGLDLAEMKEHERKAYHAVPTPVFDRRHFLGTTAWGVVGASAIVGSGLKALDHG